jgi:outer membrane protein OmpA-like peptidoglycan-associated protein
MTFHLPVRLAAIGIVSFVLLPALFSDASAQTVKAQGLIKGRSGATLILDTPDSPKLIVLLTDSTKVGQIQGVFKARRKQMSMAALIPGLAIQVEGAYNDQNQLVASSIKFKGDDLKQALSVQAGLNETRLRTQKNKEELEKQHAALEAQKEGLKRQQEQVAAQQQQLAAQKEKIAVNKAAIDAAIARFGQLDDYYILDEVTVYFGNGKVKIDPQYKSQLLRFAQRAKTIQAYMIEIKGYASSVGSVELNQKLSEDRANNVASFLLQEGHIPLTNMLAPGAMGESRQAGNDKTAEGEAENRRVVVRVLQNKGVAGLEASGL